MELKGSCHCGSVKFTVQSPHPYPFNLCYCSICRKTTGDANDRIWTPPRFASNLIDGDEVRLLTYIRPLELAYVDAGP